MFGEGDLRNYLNKVKVEKKISEMTLEQKQEYIDQKHAEAIELSKDYTAENLKSAFVDLKQLIPDIKQKNVESDVLNKTRGLPEAFNENFINELFNGIYWQLTEEELDPRDMTMSNLMEKSKLWKNLAALKDQVVIDIGCGFSLQNTYMLSCMLKASGYIGVDAFFNPNNIAASMNQQKVNEFFRNNRFSVRGEREFKDEIKAIPVSAEQEDMLSFLRRLPDNSVSIISSGIDGHVLGVNSKKDKNGLAEKIEIEIQRVLSDSGVYINFESFFMPEGLDNVVNQKEASIRRLNIYKKKIDDK